MDPPPLPPLPTTAAPPPQPTTAATESVESSPRTRTAEHHHPPPPSDDQSLPSLPSKLRLMCSFGGHIIPRPHDKTLCYVGGETRIVVVDRNSSLNELSSRISKTLLNGRPFTLKYQLPNEDLDSLISVTTDEDLENMIEEYDRVCAGNPMNKPLRIRLFLFFVKPDSVMSMGALLGDAKSESWFVDALNSADDLPRGLSDSATMDNLLNLDGVVVNCGSGSSSKIEGQGGQGQQMQGELGSEKQVEKSVNEVHSMPNSPMVENSSSFGSSSSTPCMKNLPPIRTRVEDNRNSNGSGGGVGARVLDQKEKVGVEEQFAQMGVGVNVTKQQQDEGFGVAPSAVPSQPVVVTAVNVAAGAVSSGVGVSSEYVNRVLSDDERSDQGVQVGLRKPPLPMQLGQPRAGVTYTLHSPDSVASDGSMASASSFSRQMFYQEQAPAAPRDNRAPASPTQKTDASVPSPQVHMQQVQLSRYVMHPQGDQQQHHHQQQQQPQQQPQQQFVHAGTHYIAHPPSGQVPLPSYYQVYAHQPSQQQQQQPQQQIHHPIDQQYPVYVMPMMQPPQYNMSMQSNIADSTTTVVAGSRTIASQNPNLVASSAAYKDGVPPIYPAKAPTPATPEISSGIYNTAVTSTHQLVQVPSNQYQAQYVAYSQMHHPSQSISVASSAGGNYGYEYASSAHDQGYYSQHPTTGYPAQYQTMTTAAAVELADASNQLPTEQQTRTSQP